MYCALNMITRAGNTERVDILRVKKMFYIEHYTYALVRTCAACLLVVNANTDSPLISAGSRVSSTGHLQTLQRA